MTVNIKKQKFGKVERYSFEKIPEIAPMPDLLEIQKQSYKDFIEKGINGIEVYNSIHDLQDVKRYILLAKKYNLLITGGSDFHGDSHPERTLGTTTQEKIKIYSSNLKLR